VATFSPLTNTTNTILFARGQNLPVSQQFRVTLSPKLFIAATRQVWPHDTRDSVCLVSPDMSRPITYSYSIQTCLTRQNFVLFPWCTLLFLAITPTDYTHKN